MSPSKRANHEGSVYYSATADRWIAQLSFHDEHGKRRLRRRSARSQRDAVRFRAQLVREHEAQLTGDETVGAFLERWLAYQDEWAPSTRSRQVGIVRNHLIPTIGREQLTELGVERVKRLLKSKRSAGHAPRTVNYIRAVLHAALAEAERSELVPRNVAALVKPYKLPRAEVNILSAAQVGELFEAVRGDRYEALYTLAAVSGMRSGELLGLRWQDLELDNARLEVRVQLQREPGVWTLRPPKSEAGRRAVALPLLVVASLTAHQRRQQAERDELGAHYAEQGFDDLVFTRHGGLPIHATTLVQQFQRVLEHAGLPRLRFHDLRHTAVSVMLETGVPLSTIQDVVGHADFTLTRNTYAHLGESTKRDAADRIDAVYGIQPPAVTLGVTPSKIADHRR